MLNYTVAKVPGETKTMVGENGPISVMTALANAGVDPAGFEIRVGAQLITNAADHMIEDGDRVLLFKKIKGE